MIFNQKHPTTSQWRDSEGPQALNVSATIDGARKMTWDQAQDEINFVHEKVKATIGIFIYLSNFHALLCSF